MPEQTLRQKSLLRYLNANKRRYSQGIALVWALVFVLVLLATAVAISRRSFFSLVGSSFVRDSKLAREAAEIGLTRTIVQLNMPANRRLLVNASKLNSSTATAIEADKDLISDCQQAGPDLSMSLGNLKTNSSFPVVEIDPERTYQIVSISQPASSNEKDSSFGISLGTSSAPATSGEIIISVKGTAKRGTETVGEFTITRTFEVLPKCCGRSLGGKANAFGPDSAQCDVDPGLGLIAGTYYKNNGEFEINGSKGIKFCQDNLKPSCTPIANVYCIDTSSTNDCIEGSATNLKSGTGTKLKETGATIPDVPTSSYDPKDCNDGTSSTSPEGNCVVTIDADYTLSTSDFANWGYSNTVVTLYGSSTSTFQTTVFPLNTVTTKVSQTKVICTGLNTPISSTCTASGQTVIVNGQSTAIVTLSIIPQTTSSTVFQTSTVASSSTGVSTNSSVTNSTLAKLKDHCIQPTATPTIVYCSLDRLIINTGKKLIFNTAGGPIKIYFRDKSTETDKSLVLKNGLSGLGQVNPSKSPPAYSDMQLLGIARSEFSSKGCATDGSPCQYIDMGGGNSATSGFFAYFPGGLVEFIGSTETQGMIWANSITAQGSPDFISTPGGVADVLAALGVDQDDPGSISSIFKEFVTRLTKSFKFFQ